jgi:hypothetical protein
MEQQQAWEMRNSLNILVGKPVKERDQFTDLGVDGCIILKRKTCDVRVSIGFN